MHRGHGGSGDRADRHAGQVDPQRQDHHRGSPIADTKGGEIWLINANIPEYLQANRFNHEPKRPRNAAAAQEAESQADGRGRPRRHDADSAQLYFNERGRAKLLLAVAKGKKLHDKRESEKKRDWGGRRPPAASAG